MNTVNILYFFVICLFHICDASKVVSIPGNGEKIRIGNPIPGANQINQYLPLLDGKSVACVVNHTSLINGVHVVDSLLSRKDYQIHVAKVFAPEHGFRGSLDAGAHVGDERDEKTGLPVISLYGSRKKPSPEDLSGVEVVLFDIQDVGARFYTYISTLHLVMEACSESGIPVIVLDRPNPNGYYVDGPVLEPEYRSFVGMDEIPVVYGMTIGELALMINGEGWLSGGVKCELHVIPCQEYDHNMTFELPVAPSPNLPNHRSILLYPSLCFFEGTEVSVGRGTDKQFQVLGHPSLKLHSFTFTPEPKDGAMHPLHNGVQLYGTDISSLPVIEIAQWQKLNLSFLLSYHRELNPDHEFFLDNSDFFEKLAGTANLRKQLALGLSEDEIRASWQEGLDDFRSKRSKYLLYP